MNGSFIIRQFGSFHSMFFMTRVTNQKIDIHINVINSCIELNIRYIQPFSERTFKNMLFRNEWNKIGLFTQYFNISRVKHVI